jgi:cytochrome P450
MSPDSLSVAIVIGVAVLVGVLFPYLRLRRSLRQAHGQLTQERQARERLARDTGTRDQRVVQAEHQAHEAAEPAREVRAQQDLVRAETEYLLSTRIPALVSHLRAEPAMANYGPYFVRHPVNFHGTWIQPAELVLVSYAAANTEPADVPEELRSDDGAYLGFGAGPHRCPASDPAMLIAMTAIERLTSYLCDLELAVPREELLWRPGPFHRSLARLPVRFTPIRPNQPGESPWATQPPSS